MRVVIIYPCSASLLTPIQCKGARHDLGLLSSGCPRTPSAGKAASRHMHAPHHHPHPHLRPSLNTLRSAFVWQAHGLPESMRLQSHVSVCAQVMALLLRGINNVCKEHQ